MSDALLRPEAERRVLQGPNSCTCPVGLALMCEPVVAADGHTYEHNEIEKWIRQKGASATSPTTSEILEDARLISSQQCKASIDEAIKGRCAGTRAARKHAELRLRGRRRAWRGPLGPRHG